jgi:hypothetical protein
MVALLVCMGTVSAVAALPPAQFPCFGSEECPEPVNPEPDEYYAIQCVTNSIWVWRTVPNLMFVTGIPLVQIEVMGDGDTMVVTGNVTVTRSGDTITVSGESGNFAPQSGEKSFSWSACVERNGGLPELPPVGVELTDEQIACMRLPSEQEKVDCLNALEADSETSNALACDDPFYLSTHLEECTFVSCPLDPDIRVADVSECPDAQRIAENRWRDTVITAIQTCLSSGIAMVGGSVAILGRRRKHK